jgi:hypothetical protein
MKLADAVEVFRGEPGSPSNSYQWYRKDAQYRGSVSLGGMSVLVRKISGAWWVEEPDLERALVALRERMAERHAATVDYKNRVLRGAPGGSVETDWGRYTVRGPFHLNGYSGVPRYKGYDEVWVCSTCWRPTSTEHNREECHSCSDWGGCERDCTLSRVFCSPCGTSLET